MLETSNIPHVSISASSCKISGPRSIRNKSMPEHLSLLLCINYVVWFFGIFFMCVPPDFFFTLYCGSSSRYTTTLLLLSHSGFYQTCLFLTICFLFRLWLFRCLKCAVYQKKLIFPTTHLLLPSSILWNFGTIDSVLSGLKVTTSLNRIAFPFPFPLPFLLPVCMFFSFRFQTNKCLEGSPGLSLKLYSFLKSRTMF